MAETITESISGPLTKKDTAISGLSALVHTAIAPSLVRADGRPADVVAFEESVTAFFLEAAELLGIPKSVAAIYRVGEDIEIKFTGLKPGEKLFEELQHHTEAYAATEHPRIMRFTSKAMFSESGVQELEKNLYQYDSNQLKSILKQLVPEYQPYLE